jgi:hypothetical protein
MHCSMPCSPMRKASLTVAFATQSTKPTEIYLQQLFCLQLLPGYHSSSSIWHICNLFDVDVTIIMTVTVLGILGVLECTENIQMPSVQQVLPTGGQDCWIHCWSVKECLLPKSKAESRPRDSDFPWKKSYGQITSKKGLGKIKRFL